MVKIGLFSDFVLHPNANLDDNLKRIINDNDFNVLNLEAPFVLPDFKPISKPICLSHFTDNTAFFHKHNFKYLNLANNHIMDYQKAGLENTQIILNKSGIKYFGAGFTLEESLKPVTIDCSGFKVALWGFASRYADAINATKNKPGTAPITPKTVKEALNNYNADIKIGYFHYGAEFEDYPEPYFKELFEELVFDDYLDIIVGNHSHSTQGVRRIDNKSIFYSLGNFIFPFTSYGDVMINHPESSKYGYFVNIELSKESVNSHVIPYYLENNSTFARSLNESEEKTFLLKFNQISKPLLLSNREYKRFYLKNRKRKYFPIVSRKEWVNRIKLPLFRKLEMLIGKFTKAIGIHAFIKDRISKKVK